MHLDFGPQKSIQNIALVLHGLPGIRSRQNRDLAEKLNAQFGLSTRVIFYPGLGIHPGEFSFSKSVHEVETQIIELLKDSPQIKIHLIGHSFGGYLSLRMLQKFPQAIQSLFLMSPLVFELSRRQLEYLGNEIRTSNPTIHFPTIDEIYPDYEKTNQQQPVENFKNPPFAKTPIYMIQAKEDQITPTKTAQHFVEDTHIQYCEILQNHSFLQDRAEVLAHIDKFYKSIGLIKN